MTHYDNLMDSIVDEIYYVWTEVSSWNADDQKTARETAHRILQHVEEFQQNRSTMTTTHLKPRPQWRASD